MKQVADTMSFPNPFEFKKIDSPGLSKSVIYNRCLGWLAKHLTGTVSGAPTGDSLNGKILLPEIHASADVTYTLNIDVKEGKYRCVLENYILHTEYGPLSLYASKDLPGHGKESKMQMLLIVRNIDQIFQSLAEFVRKDDNF
jgi:hypothetical protein